MTEEVANRIAEALEGIEADATTFLVMFAFFAAAFWIIAIFKK